MHKTLLIIKREYLTRVRKKTFIIGTILFPLLYLGLIFGTGYIDKKSKQTLNVAIVDSSGLFTQQVLDNENMLDSSNTLHLSTASEADLASSYEKKGYSGYIIIPANIDWKGNLGVQFNSQKTYSSITVAPITNKLNKVWSKIKYAKLDIDSAKNILKGEVKIVTKNIKDNSVNADVAAPIGIFCGILMYIILLLYGSQVMMGVTEEKTNRIAEVMVSSVKPFQLMLGKIVGIGMVALTQILIWITCVFLIYNVSQLYGGGNSGVMTGMVGNIQKVFTSVNIGFVLCFFVFYLLAGFFFYSSLYAAIGSAINEDMREAQSLSFPITMLIIFSISIVFTAISNPTGPIATWASIIPFSSPIIMMARIPFGVPNTVPWWQLALSMSLLIIGFIFTTWFAGKIYRTGILMYGKKPSWKEMLKWAFKK